MTGYCVHTEKASTRDVFVFNCDIGREFYFKMGKKDKKKKGKGAEKTASKTEKKAVRKFKKDLHDKGEEDIEKLIAEFQELDKKRFEVIEQVVPPPSPRSSFSLNVHPDKDEIVLFGGEYFNGNKTYVYNDLFLYNLKKQEWISLSVPNGPAPRCAHQAVTLAQSGGQLWIFGGEFASPSQSQFYHYKELWVFHFHEKKWEKITAPGSPSPRSGHRMVVVKRQLMIFGGFNDNSRDYKYFNDVHLFNLDTYSWEKVEITAKAPSPRSGCLMSPLSDGRVLVYGGYSKDRIKKDVDSGQVHEDMFLLQLHKGDTSALKWKWVKVKQAGTVPSPRCGCSVANAPNDRSFVFGGVFDKEDDEEQLHGVFHADLYQLDLETARWTRITLSGPKKERKRRRKPKAEGGEAVEDSEDDPEVEEEIVEKTKQETTVIDDSGIFTVKIGPSTSSTVCSDRPESTATDTERKGFWPRARINAGTVVIHGVLYLYSGMYEDGDKQITLDDFYSLDLRRLDGWKVLNEGKAVAQQEWLESESSGDDEDEEHGDYEDEENGDKDDDEEEEDEVEIKDIPEDANDSEKCEADVAGPS